MKFYSPTKIFKGERCLFENSSSLILGTRAFIVTGRSSGRLSGALAEVEKILIEEGIPYALCDRISNNPTVEECYEAGREAREFGADFIIGIGGGSPLDAAKAIAVYTANPDMSEMDIYNGNFPNKPLTMTAIPTTAGTGSEVTQYSILTVHAENNKRGFGNEDTFFKTAFLDGRYTENLPLQITRNTAVDALSHLVESYLCRRTSEMTEYIALEGMRIIGKEIDNLISGNLTSHDRNELLWASTLGGIVIAQTGTTIVHSMGYALTFFKDIPHGMANGLLMTEFLKKAEKVLPEKVDRLLRVLGVDTLDRLDEVLKCLLPTDLTVTEDDIEKWLNITFKPARVASCPYEVTRDIEKEIFEKSLK